MKKIVYLLALCGLITGCSHKTTGSSSGGAVVGYSPSPAKEEVTEEKPAGNFTMQTVRPEGMVPYATAFRMNGDFADNVAITIGNDGQLTYFPDPADITADSRPVNLGNGWWLNNQGLGKNSVFTKYTFAEYAELSQVPTVEQLKQSVIAGSKVTEMVELPYKIGDTTGHIDAIKEYLKNY